MYWTKPQYTSKPYPRMWDQVLVRNISGNVLKSIEQWHTVFSTLIFVPTTWTSGHTSGSLLTRKYCTNSCRFSSFFSVFCDCESLFIILRWVIGNLKHTSKRFPVSRNWKSLCSWVLSVLRKKIWLPFLIGQNCLWADIETLFSL